MLNITAVAAGLTSRAEKCYHFEASGAELDVLQGAFVGDWLACKVKRGLWAVFARRKPPSIEATRITAASAAQQVQAIMHGKGRADIRGSAALLARLDSPLTLQGTPGLSILS